MKNSLRHIPLSFDPQDSDNSCFNLLGEMSPQWKPRDRIKLQRFTDGITNTLIKASRELPEQFKADRDRDAVLIRAYGSGTSNMIDREKEIRAHNLLAYKGMASPLLARFENGFIYGFIPGDPCEPQDFHDAKTSREIAKRLGEWHGRLPTLALANIASGEDTPNIWTNAQKWIDLLPSDTPELRARNEGFRNELAWLFDRFGSLTGLRGHDFVFSHTDLLCANVILEQRTDGNQQARAVTFIDYEYATAAPAAFDIVNVFAEWAGYDGELSWMPSKSQRRDFIKHYVTSFHQHTEAIGGTAEADPESDVAHLYEQVEACRGLPGFYWGIWGLIQANISDIDFDYVAYAARRHSEYDGWKAEFDGSRERSGRQPTIREQAWAKV